MRGPLQVRDVCPQNPWYDLLDGSDEGSASSKSLKNLIKIRLNFFFKFSINFFALQIFFWVLSLKYPFSGAEQNLEQNQF